MKSGYFKAFSYVNIVFSNVIATGCNGLKRGAIDDEIVNKPEVYADYI